MPCQIWNWSLPGLSYNVGAELTKMDNLPLDTSNSLYYKRGTRKALNGPLTE